MLVVRNFEIHSDCREGVVPHPADTDRIAEGIFAARPALIVNGQLILNIRTIDRAVVVVIDTLGIERQLIVGIR